MRIIFITFFLLLMNAAFSQLITLNDTNLRDKLIASYPQVMQGNSLDISKAALLTGSLNLTNAHITDATGIQHFTKITTLDLSHNDLTIIPDISLTTGLINFYASYNNLTSMPDMSALTQLHDFQVMYNQLTALPNLSGTGLVFLYCSYNNITQLPPLTQFPNLVNLVVGSNPFINPMFDASPCKHLVELHVHKSGINTIAGLDQLPDLSILYLWGNNLTAIPGIDANTSLTKLYIFDNPISDLPNLSNKPYLNKLDISKCYLTFEDIQSVFQLTNIPASFTYTPQRDIPYADVTVRAENNYVLSYPVNSPLATNRYVWLKNGSVVDSSASPTYSFTPLKSTDAGTYQLRVYNTSIPSLLLKTNIFTVSVLPCMEYSITNVDIVSKDCSKGYMLDFSQNQLSGGTAPFQYQLSTSSSIKLITYPIVENVEAGNYFLTIIDSKNCRVTDDFMLNRIDNCDPVITPNGDGVADTYFIEKSGKVSVYDLNRALVNTLQAPFVWDGTDRNGKLLDAGFYILIMEGQKPIYLTIIR